MRNKIFPFTSRHIFSDSSLPWSAGASISPEPMKHSPLQPSDSPRTRRRKRTIGRPSIKPILEKHNFTVEFLHPLIKILANLLYCCNSPHLDPPLLAPSASLSDCF